nr:fasciclin domain-containing protein [uncultured Bacteroides sp.]
MKKKSIFFACILFLFTSCNSEMDKYYELPSWLKGNSWEVLEAKGNFSIFLKGVEKTSYKELVQGKGQITVMAPTDDAFKAYFAKRKINSLDDLSANELDKLIAYHLVYYSFTKERFENYSPEGIDAESETTSPGLFYKFRTKSRDAITSETDSTDNKRVKMVMHKERFLPVFSSNLFNSKHIDAKSNYEYFYPTSTWSGDKGFNVSNATVNEYSIVTDNGYVYTLNQVVDPLETIYSKLSGSADYSTFRNIYDKFINYKYDASSTASYGKGDSLFVHYHTSLPAIASEWTNDLNSSVSDYAQLSNLSKKAMNVFAPDNTSLQTFYDKYWRPYYGNSGINNVNFVPLLALLSNHVNNGEVLFPETIESGKVVTSWVTPIVFDTKSAKLRQMCVNGTLYGLDHVIVPPMFEKVTAPMFCNPEYNMFLDMSSSYIDILLSDQNQFKVFYPTDNMIVNHTTYAGASMKYINTNSKKYGSQEIQIEGLNGLETMKYTQKKILSGNHIVIKTMSSRDDETIYKTISPFNYIYSKGNNIYSSATYNSGAEAPTFKKINSWSNGTAYALEGDASALVPEFSQFKDVVTSAVACPSEFSGFSTLIGTSGLAKSVPAFNFLQGNRFIVLIPTQKAITDASSAGKIPPTTKLADFLKYYFVDVNSSNLLDYPFPGANVKGELTTFRYLPNGQMAKLTLIDTGSGLKIKDSKGNTVNVVSYFPKIYSDGAAYLIDGILEVE